MNFYMNPGFNPSFNTPNISGGSGDIEFMLLDMQWQMIMAQMSNRLDRSSFGPSMGGIAEKDLFANWRPTDESFIDQSHGRSLNTILSICSFSRSQNIPGWENMENMGMLGGGLPGGMSNGGLPENIFSPIEIENPNNTPERQVRRPNNDGRPNNNVFEHERGGV